MGCGSSQPATEGNTTSASAGRNNKKSSKVPAPQSGYSDWDDSKFSTAPPLPTNGSGDGAAAGARSSHFTDPNAAFQSFLVRDKDKAASIVPRNVTTTKDDKQAGADDGAHHVKNVFARPLEINDDYEPPFHNKSRDEAMFIADALQKNFVFENLSKRDLKPLIGAFEKVRVPKEQIIIRQGDEGDWFYIILKGSVSFIVDGNKVGQAQSGNSFGELALLYTCPRAATVQALEEAVLFRVDQTTFRYILQSQTRKGISDKVDLLYKIPFLRDLPDEDVAQLTAVMTPHKFTQGEYLMRKGDAADNFYIVQEGTLMATNIGLGESKFEDVLINPGDYVGERALVTGDPRAADVVAKSDGLAFYIDKDTFERVLGKLNDVIIRAQDQRLIVSVFVLLLQQYGVLSKAVQSFHVLSAVSNRPFLNIETVFD
jgi:cAMP-dependent protein kinase regulator